MKQNIYDDKTFFSGYQSLRQSESGYNRYLEEPAVHAFLPDLENKCVLDIGCGFGDFSKHAINLGAGRYLGIDISQKMLAEALKLKTGNIDFENCSIEDYSYPREQFDLVIASLCLHYVEDISAIFRKVYNCLKPDGTFVFSVEHPICTSLLQGLYESKEGSHWPVDRYFDESERRQNWFVDGVIKYHRTTESYIGALLNAGFRLQGLAEPQPSNELIQQQPQLKLHSRRPALLVFKLAK
ncbi:class I SAM-dependent methyltransferase [Vibrio sp. WXL103]|uniref:class I SAM-dependent methyltransferase n=1 Tax=Vibrio sp. WXL103 TaxID=3450710 RepID=UPI003EC8251A